MGDLSFQQWTELVFDSDSLNRATSSGILNRRFVIGSDFASGFGLAIITEGEDIRSNSGASATTDAKILIDNSFLHEDISSYFAPILLFQFHIYKGSPQ